MSDLWIGLGRIQNKSDLLPCPCWTLNLILIFTLFNRLPERLAFPACLFLLNLFSFPNSLPPYPSFVSVPFSSSCFTFSFQSFPLPLFLKVCVTCLYSYSTRVFVTLCGWFHNWMLLHFLKQ